MANMTGAVTASFGYDEFGRRITRTVGGATEKYLYDDGDVIQQLDGSGTVAANYFGVGGDEPWQRSDIGAATTNRSYLADGLGSVVALADANQVLQTQYAYEPFGATATTGSSNKNSYQFTAREDDGTGLYGYRNRYYQPALGRFVSEDPLVDDVGPYIYCGNDPINGTDPLGLAIFELTPEGRRALAFARGAGFAVAETVLNASISAATYGIYGTLIPWQHGRCYNTGGYDVEFHAGYRVGTIYANIGVMALALSVSGVTINPGLLYEENSIIAAGSASGDINVIGRTYDTEVAKDWPGHNVLDIPDWTTAKNDAWIQGIIDRQATVYVASPETEANLWDAANNRARPFATELQQLLNAGYTRVGDYMYPPMIK